jgi:hypothetical protein
MKTNRLHELVSTGDGIAILEQGLCFGGGDLGDYGINSNTSANGFIKCTYKKREIQTDSPSPTKTNKKQNSSEKKKVEDDDSD